MSPSGSPRAEATNETTRPPAELSDAVILAERAAALARVPSSDEARRTLAVAEFSLGAERYAIETRYVREVVRLADFVPVPGAPELVTGLTGVRGEVVAIFDLRRLLGVPVRGVTDLSRVVVLGEERAEFGVLADAILGLVEIAEEDVQDASGSMTGAARDFVRGVTREALVLLDGKVLLSDRRLYVDQRTDTTG